MIYYGGKRLNYKSKLPPFFYMFKNKIIEQVKNELKMEYV